MKHLVVILLLIPSFVFGAGGKIEQTIYEFIDVTPNWYDWKKNDSSIAFLSTRCGANFRLVAGRAQNAGLKEGDEFFLIHKIFLRLGAMMSSANGISQDRFNEKFDYWINTYLNEGEDNMNKFNTFVDGKFAEDFDACGKKVFPVVKSIIEEVGKNMEN